MFHVFVTEMESLLSGASIKPIFNPALAPEWPIFSGPLIRQDTRGGRKGGREELEGVFGLVPQTIKAS